MQVLDVARDGHALGAVEIGEPAHLALEGCIPVDAPACRIGLGDRQQVGMPARQALGDGRAQLAGGAPLTGSPAMPSAR